MRSWTLPHRQLKVVSFILISLGCWSPCYEEFPPETKLGHSVEKPFGLPEERLHVRSLHMRAGEDLLAVPVFDDQQALGVLWVFVHSDAMAGGLVSHHGLDDRFKLSSCRFQLVRPDGACDHDGDWFGIGVHRISRSCNASSLNAELTKLSVLREDCSQ